MSELYDPNLVQWLQLSGEHIVKLRPLEERAQWVEFLIKEIEAMLPADEATAVLVELQGDITYRLQQATWPTG